MKRFAALLLAALLSICSLTLAGCAEQKEQKMREEVTTMTLTAFAPGDLQQLDLYPNLTTVDLRGSTCYQAIFDYIAAHPNIAVTYDVTICGKVYAMDTAYITLTDGSYELQELMEKLPYLKNVSALELPSTTLTPEELALFAQTYPQISLTYSVDILGVTYPQDAEAVNLSALQPENITQVLAQLENLPLVTQVELMDEAGASSLSPTDVRILMDALPEAAFSYRFELFGQELSTDTETVEYYCVEIGNEGVAQVREALDIMPKCTYFKMDGCGIDNEVMAQLRDDYPETKIVWRVWLVEPDYNSKLFLRCGSYLTDTHRIRTTYVNDENSHVLNYCTETKYVDVGHVWQLTQCEFLAYMPDLEVCIIAITEITDISPLANHEKLEYLELFTTDISDLTPLLTCPNIEHLNLSNMPKLRDISPVYTLTKLQRLRMVDSPLIPAEQFKEAAERLPNCTMLNQGHFATAWFWRYYDGAKQHKVPRYELLCEQMEYTKDALEYGIP